MVSAQAEPSSLRTTLHYLGPPGTYSHQVALELAPRLKQRSVNRSATGRSASGPDHARQGSSTDGRAVADDLPSSSIVLRPCSTIRSTVTEARLLARSTGMPSLALLPYENNSNGPVVDSYEILHARPDKLQVVAEAYLPVSHSLLVTRETETRLRAGKGKVTLEDLARLDVVASHTQALGQCSRFLEANARSDVELLATSSTGEAAKRLVDHANGQKQKNGARAVGERSDSEQTLEACIASRVCTQADVYGLVELFSDIQNSDGNTTRFLLCQLDGDDGKVSAYKHQRHAEDQTEPRVRALFHVELQSNTSTMLTDCIAAIARSSSSAAEEKVEMTVRKMDRVAMRYGEEEGRSDVSYHHDEGRWASTYVIEMEARDRGHIDIVDDEQDELARKKRKLDRRSSSSADHLEERLDGLAQALNAAATRSGQGLVTCLGIWLV